MPRYSRRARTRAPRRSNRRFGTRARTARRYASLSLTKYVRPRPYSFMRRTMLYGGNVNTGSGAIGDALSTSASGYKGIAFNIYFTQLPNYTDFVNLYDDYKINFVKLRVIHHATNLSLIESANNQDVAMPEVYFVHDDNDVTAPASTLAGANEMREVAKCKVHYYTGEKRVARFGFKPNVLVENYKTALTTGYTPAYNRWISTTDVALPYYAVKLMFYQPNLQGAGGLTASQIAVFTVEAEYYFQCRGVR